MRFRLSTKLILLTYCVVLLVGAMIAIYSAYEGRRRIYASFREEEVEIANIVASASADYIYLLDISKLRLLLESVHKDRDVLYTYVTDIDGLILADGTAENALRDTRPRDAFSDRAFAATGWLLEREGAILKVGGPIRLPDGRRVGYLHFGFSMGRAFAAVHRQTGAIAVITFICLAIGVVLTFVFSARFSRPVLAMARASESIGDGDFDVRVTVGRTDELGMLAQSINRMAKSLKTTTVSRDYVESIIKTMSDALIVVEPDGSIRSANRAASLLLGYTERELLGSKIGALFEREVEWSRIAGLIERGLSISGVEKKFRTKDGKSVPVLFSGAAMRGAEGKIGAMAFVARDITDRKEHERRMARINDCFMRLGADSDENINRLVVLCGELMGATCALYNRLEGGMLCSVGQWNTPPGYNPIDKPDGHICYDVIQYAGGEISGDEPAEGGPSQEVSFGGKTIVVRDLPNTVYATTDPNVRAYGLKTYIGKAVRCGKTAIGSLCVVYQEDFVPTKGDKELMGILASAVGTEEERRSATNELKRAYIALRDAQAQLVQSAKMASVGQLAGGVAHEINNPLTAILNNIQLVKEDLHGKDIKLDEVGELVDIIEQASLRCKRITKSLLDFSRVPRGELQPVDLAGEIDKVLDLVGHEMSLENIVIGREFKPDVPRACADPQLVQQVVHDIINNARWAIREKSKGKGGIITVKTEYAPDTKMACIYVSDTGKGIPKENLDRIFEPFFTTKPVGEGTGLGLSIVYNIVKKNLRGDIEVESDVDKGTTFKVLLPTYDST